MTQTTTPEALDTLSAEIVEALNEPNGVLVRKVVETIGTERTREYFQQTLDIEARGGMLVVSGKRRRTPGGVFFYLVRKGISKAERKTLFPNAPQEGAAKVPIEPLPWEEALKYTNVLLKHPKGEARSVELKLIGRPAKVAKAQNCMVAMMEEKSTSPSLPKGLPKPPEQTRSFAVFISTKQWNRVSEQLKTNAKAELLVRGQPVFHPEKAMTMLLAQSVEVIERAPKKNKAEN